MNWKLRALILKALAAAPGGGALYQLLQSRFGYFRRGDYIENRLSKQRELAACLLANGSEIDGARVMEVGTGWVPLAPLGFWICGAAGVITFDLSRYMIPSLLRHACDWIGANRATLVDLWSGLRSERQIDDKLDVIDRLKDRPGDLLRAAGIEYRAPADAAATGLPDASIDVHYSANVFEHVPPRALRRILSEGRRVLRPGGMAVHHADPSDHFAHSDPSISRINFLRFEDQEWRSYYDNRYSYLNRCHDSDYRRLFEGAKYRLIDCRFKVEAGSLQLLRSGFPLASPFRGKSLEDLSRGNLTYVATPLSR
jgi:SAM-dependent methyltransferase